LQHTSESEPANDTKKREGILNYQSVMGQYTRIHKRIWKMLFANNFKRFGKDSSIIFPLIIQNAQYIEIGDDVGIYKKAWLHTRQIDENIPRLVIDDGTKVGNFAHIAAVRDVYIGKNISIADKVYISDNLHTYEDVTRPIRQQPVFFKNSVHIGDDSWIGDNVSIIGAKIGRHCVIGANSVVTRDVPDYSVAVGAPARVIKRYNFEAKEWQRVDKHPGS
jgi:acetyltransferase-like isoleucine patch superfamily enzyme